MEPTTLKTWIRWAMIMCLVASTNRSEAQLDCMGVDGGTALPGTTCADGNPNTINDHYNNICWCVSEDGNGGCFPPNIQPGHPCDDMDPATLGDQWNSYCDCEAMPNFISGTVFLDLDGNGLFDGTDLPMAHRTVQAGPGAHYAPSNTTGEFLIGVPAGAFELQVESTPYYEQSQPLPTVDLIGTGTSVTEVVVPMTPLVIATDLSLQMGVQSAVRPGYIHTVYLFCRNEATEVTGGTLSFTFDPLNVYLGCSPEGSLDGNTLTWQLPTLQVGELAVRKVFLSIQTGVALGELMHYSGTLVADHTDVMLENNIFVSQPVVVGSCDPNDKQVWPPVLAPEDVSSQRPVEYMIRFQNTGTYEAENIRIADVLPEDLDVSTFQFIASSHPCITTITGRLLEFRFDGIMLPDSNANEPESHGYVAFNIAPDGDLLPGDSVQNGAAIYFDFNEPVITNAATFSVELNTAVAPNSVEVPAVSLWPNPVTDVLNIAVPRARAGSARISIIDLNGRIVRSMNRALGSSAITVPVADLANGLYTIRIESQGKTTSHRFVRCE